MLTVVFCVWYFELHVYIVSLYITTHLWNVNVRISLFLAHLKYAPQFKNWLLPVCLSPVHPDFPLFYLYYYSISDIVVEPAYTRYLLLSLWWRLNLKWNFCSSKFQDCIEKVEDMIPSQSKLLINLLLYLWNHIAQTLCLPVCHFASV